ATLSPSWPERPSLAAYLEEAGVPAIHGVDTRAIAQRVREHGAMPAALSVHTREAEPSPAALRHALEACDYDERDFVAETTIPAPAVYGAGARRIALLDCGNKTSVIEELVRRDTQVVALPARTTAGEI